MNSPHAYVKQSHHADPALFATEAAGLEWLAAAQGARVARVLEVTPGRLAIERIEPGRPSAQKALTFGEQLATTHASGAQAFGGAPPDAPGPVGFIGPTSGPLPMSYGHWSRWGDFFAAARLLPYVRMARDAGDMDGSDSALFDRIASRLAAGAFDDDLPVARVHGDLWSGNLLWSEHDAVMIDPAAHGGHPVDDLAMLALFSTPCLEHIYTGYETAAGLPSEWRERLPLHQLYPLLVHTVLFGRAYLGQALRIAQRFA